MLISDCDCRKGLKDIKDLRDQAMQEGKLTPRMKEMLSRKQGEKYRQPLMSKIDPQQGSAADSGKAAATAAASAKRTSAAPAKPRIGERKDKSPIKVCAMSSEIYLVPAVTNY